MKHSYLKRFFTRIFPIKYPDILKEIDADKLSKRLNYIFTDKKLLVQALKHRSYLAFTGEQRASANERLEFLGDAVLGMVVTEFLYRKFKHETEGVLTNYKSLLVSGRLLSHVAKDFELGRYILLNDSEARSGGRKRTSILADTVEAIIGALYLDGGIEPARQFIHTNITNRLETVLKDGDLRNNKSLLQEYCQSLSLDGPIYRVEKEIGPDHRKMFTVSVFVDGNRIGTGTGTSKKKAEQVAAHEGLHTLNLL